MVYFKIDIMRNQSILILLFAMLLTAFIRVKKLRIIRQWIRPSNIIRYRLGNLLCTQ